MSDLMEEKFMESLDLELAFHMPVEVPHKNNRHFNSSWLSQPRSPTDLALFYCNISNSIAAYLLKITLLEEDYRHNMPYSHVIK
jgi:hypothetical protein